MRAVIGRVKIKPDRADEALAMIGEMGVAMLGGTRAAEDLSIENLARLAAQRAADLGCDVVVGFSIGADIALEMAASGAFGGPLVLLAPSFSRRDEAVFCRLLDRLARVLGHLPFAALLKMMGPAMKRMPLPPGRREVLAVEFRENDPRVVRHGERGDGGITDVERRTLEACPRIHVITLRVTRASR